MKVMKRDSDDDFRSSSVNVTNNSPSRDYSHPDDQTTQTTETPGFKPFTVIKHCYHNGRNIIRTEVIYNPIQVGVILNL